MTSEDVLQASAKEQLEAFLDEHRAGLRASLDGLSEAEARLRLVPSATTLLGLVKHAAFVERVWFDEGVTRRPRSEIGIPERAEDSFELRDGDTIASVLDDHEQACATSRRHLAGLELDDFLEGNRRGPLPLRWACFHVLRELAQHGGHADILREQVLARRRPADG